MLRAGEPIHLRYCKGPRPCPCGCGTEDGFCQPHRARLQAIRTEWVAEGQRDAIRLTRARERAAHAKRLAAGIVELDGTDFGVEAA